MKVLVSGVGDHICYNSNLAKLLSHFPDWRLQDSMESILEGKVRFLRQREA